MSALVRTLAGSLLIGLSLILVGGVSLADELRVEGSESRLVIHGPEETLAHYCMTDAEGRLWLELPGGWRFELVASISDPAISNPGDGSFHPFEIDEVHAALAELSFPLGVIRADVFILPYPRRAGLESAAGPGIVLLSPGVRPLSREHQHAEFVHELGHVVQHALLPDSDLGSWETYRRMRGIQDDIRFSAAAIHADRPHEIFAEDFRALFGGGAANYSGSIENTTLASPGSVAGLREFMVELSGTTAISGRLLAYPNPARGAVHFSQPSEPGALVPLDLFDAAGRRITSLEPSVGTHGARWIWDGRDARGRPVARGQVFARPRGSRGQALRLSVLN